MKFDSTKSTDTDDSRRPVGDPASDRLPMWREEIGGEEIPQEAEKLFRHAVGLCSLAYKDPGHLRLNPGIAGASTIESFERGSMGALGLQTEKGNFLVFRGTDSILDWAYNLCCAPVPIRWVPRHGGFYVAWTALRRQVLEWVERVADGRSSDFVIVGHSLGGAMALFAAQEMALEKRTIRQVVTLGAPRAGGSIFSSRYEDTPANLDAGQTLGDVTWRLVNETDAVARSPLWLLNLRHVGHLLYIDRGGIVRSGVEAQRAMATRTAEMNASIGPPRVLPPPLPEDGARRARYFGSSPGRRRAVPMKWPPKVIRHIDFWLSAAFPKVAGMATACLARTLLLLSGATLHHFSSRYVDAFYPPGDAPYSRLPRPATRLADRSVEWILFASFIAVASGLVLTICLLIEKWVAS